MAITKDTGDSPAQETGVTETNGALRGEQSFNEILKRELEKVETPEPEEEAVEETVSEEDPLIQDPEETPEVEEDAEPEEQVSEDEPEPEEEAEPEEEEPVLSQEDEEEDKQQEQRVPLKRLNKEVARRKDLEERFKRSQARIAELEAGSKQQEAAPPQSVPSDPLPEIPSPQELDKLRDETEATVDFIEETLIRDPNDVNDSGEPVYRIEGQGEFTPVELRMMLRSANKRLRREIPAKQQFLQQRTQINTQAAQLYPWLNDHSSAEYQQFQQVLAARPYLMKNDPTATMLAAAAVEGLKRPQKQKAAVKPKAKRQIAPPVDTTSSAPPKRATGSKAARDKLRSYESKTLAKGKLSERDSYNVLLQRELAKQNG